MNTNIKSKSFAIGWVYEKTNVKYAERLANVSTARKNVRKKRTESTTVTNTIKRILRMSGFMFSTIKMILFGISERRDSWLRMETFQPLMQYIHV